MKVNVHDSQEPKRKSLFSGKEREKEKAPKKGLSLGSKKKSEQEPEVEVVQEPIVQTAEPEVETAAPADTYHSTEDPSLSTGVSEESVLGEVVGQPVEEGQCTPESDTPDEVEVAAPQTTTEEAEPINEEPVAADEVEVVEDEVFDELVYADKWSLSGGFVLCTLATCVLMFTAGFVFSDAILKLGALLGVF